MTPKNSQFPKKPNKKDVNKLPKIPKGAKVFTIDLQKILSIALIIFILWALFRSFGANLIGATEKVINTKTNLQEISQNYKNRVYPEVRYYNNGTFEAFHPEKKTEQNGKIITTQQIDKIVLPKNMTPDRVGLYDSQNPTKFVTPEEGVMALVKEIAMGILPVILFLFLLIFFMGRAGGGPMGGAMSFIRSRAKEYDPDGKDKVLFKDVAGSEEEKSDLEEVVDFLKNPEKYKKL